MSGFALPGQRGGIHPDVTGADGKRYTWDAATNQYTVLEGLPGKAATTKYQIVKPSKANGYTWHIYDPATGKLQQVTQEQAAQAQTQGLAEAGSDQASGPYAGPGSDMQSMPGDPTNSQLPSGDSGSAAPIQQLLNLSSSGGSGDGVGWANFGLAQQKFAHQQAQDLITNAKADHAARLNAAMQVLNALAAQSSSAQQMDAERNKNIMAAMPYGIDPNQQYFGGEGPNDYAVKMGLMPALAVQHMQYNPNPAPDPNAAARQAALAHLQSLAQGG